MNGITKDISHVYAGSKLIASITDVAGLNTINYMHGDHLGSISVITDQWGAVVERLRFDVFGLPVDPNTGAAKANIAANNTSRGYTGHEMDASTGLINMNARLYDPVLGRFISADTMVPGAGNMQAFNRYAYVLNNPLAYTDPTGHIANFIIGAIIGAIVGGISAAINGGSFSDILLGAVIGAAVGAISGGVYTGLESFGPLLAGMGAGAAGGAAGGLFGTMAAGGGKYFKNITSGAFFGAIAGAVTGGMLEIQYVEINEVVASMAGAFTSGTMRGGFDDSFIAVAYAAGAMAASYVVRGAIGEVQTTKPARSDVKLYAANDDGTMRDFEYSNEDGIAAAEAGISVLKKIEVFFRNLTSRGSVTSKVIGGAAGTGVKALDVGVWQDVDQMTLRTIMMNCIGSGTCDVSVTQMYNNYPAGRQQLIDAIQQSGYRRRP